MVLGESSLEGCLNLVVVGMVRWRGVDFLDWLDQFDAENELKNGMVELKKPVLIEFGRSTLMILMILTILTILRSLLILTLLMYLMNRHEVGSLSLGR